MRLSEALVLKAEWWMIPYPESAYVEYELDKANMFMETTRLLNNQYPEHIRRASNADRANLCLLESELQKDEEVHQELVNLID